ncbi:DNA-binding response regulator [Chitinophaga silvatica]|uniref:DNA-binding response regulator n=1 Tax=Chitinophaga silvatica TaxID=2282649 RepID=A0A3E1Y859_9BACT|nr:response regulator transcription factor [Chitinophaga silvatica]RFS21327.1 DNA-binding response regulator [Chitinophaga silvatica]
MIYPTIKIAIIDDHLMVINGLKAMLAGAPDMDVIFECQDGNKLLEHLATLQPNVILMDIQLPDISGVELCKTISRKYPDVRVIALTSHDDSHYVRQMLRNGAAGYLLKNTDYNTLLKAIRDVNEGKQYLDNQIQQNLIHEAITGQRVSKYEIPLTKREVEVLKYIGEALSNQEIAEKLYISLRTVETHRFNITQKLGVKNTASLVKEAIKRGLA